MTKINSMEQFSEVIKGALVVMIAKTNMCSVCGPIASKLELFIKEYPTIPVYSIYADELDEFSGQHLVFAVPTILIFQESKEILRESRFIDFNKIKRLFDLYFRPQWSFYFYI
jgi:hypothetical protein